MKLAALATLMALTALPANAAQAIVTTPIAKAQTTATGKAIALPQGPVQVTALTVEIPAGGKLPPHVHPYPRFEYVLAGRLRVTYVDAKTTREVGPGDFLIEAVGETHFAEAVGSKPVKLLVIDQTPPGHVNSLPATK